MEKNFVTWKVRTTPTLSEYLMGARHAKRLQIEDLARTISIRPLYLNLLERGSFEKLPGDVYVRGFIRKYALALGLDPEHAVKLYQREKDITRHVARAKAPRRSVLKRVRNPLLLLSPRAFFVSLASVAMVVVSFYVWGQFSHLATSPALEVFEPSDHAVMKSFSLVVTGKTDVGTNILVNGQKVFTDVGGNFTETVMLQDGVNAISVVARNKFGKETSVTKEVRAEVAEVDLARAR